MGIIQFKIHSQGCLEGYHLDKRSLAWVLYIDASWVDHLNRGGIGWILYDTVGEIVQA